MSFNRKVAGFESLLTLAVCRGVLEQDTEPQIAPDVPCMDTEFAVNNCNQIVG